MLSHDEEQNGHEKRISDQSERPGPIRSPDGLEGNSFFEVPGSSASKKRRLPPLLDHFNARDLKELFKCSIAVWVITLFIVINPVLRAEGQAMFFGWYVASISSISQPFIQITHVKPTLF